MHKAEESHKAPEAAPGLNDGLGTCPLPNGCTLYWEPNEVGGRRYASDEVGGGVHVWDTALVNESTLLAALTIEAALRYREIHGRA